MYSSMKPSVPAERLMLSGRRSSHRETHSWRQMASLEQISCQYVLTLLRRHPKGFTSAPRRTLATLRADVRGRK